MQKYVSIRPLISTKLDMMIHTVPKQTYSFFINLLSKIIYNANNLIINFMN